MNCAKTLLVAAIATLTTLPVEAGAILVVSSEGESEIAGPPLVRRINDEGRYVEAIDVPLKSHWANVEGLRWVGRTEEPVPTNILLDFRQEFFLPDDFVVEYALFFTLADYMAFPSLNDFDLSETAVIPTGTCEAPPIGLPGCSEVYSFDVTSYLQPGLNWYSALMISQGENVGHAWSIQIEGGFGIEPEPTPEPSSTLLLVTGSMLLWFYRKKSAPR